MDISSLVYIDSTGYHFTDYPSFQAWLVAQYQGIYGADVYIEPDSQDGQFLAIVSKALYDTAAVGASTYNSFSPLTAQGAGLARVVKINGLTKLVPSFSTVTLTIVGTTGTVITNGIASDTLNQQWLLPTTVTIPDAGTIDVTATAALIGFVTADIATITTIYTPTLGWQTVNNAAAATPGAAVETDAALRIRQSISTSNPALTVFEATVGAVANVTGVTKVYGYENNTNSDDANSLPPHSICIVAIGGDETDVCNAIVSKKTPGTDTYGGNNSVSKVVYDNQGMPLTIKYDTGSTAEIQVTVTGTALPGYSADFAALIQSAVAAYINSLPIGGNTTNEEVNPFSIIPSAYLNGAIQGGTYVITAITVGKNSGMQGSSPVALLFDENPVCNGAADVTISIS